MKRIVITGCSSGFGFQASKLLGERGDRVYSTMRNVNGKNSESAADLELHSANIRVVELDVLSDESVDTAAAQILDDGGPPDVLINNAGQMFLGLTEAFTTDEFTRQMDINVFGVHRVTRALLPSMREADDGLIMNISSVAGRIAAPFFGIYNASKWALEGYSLALRRELASSGIDVVVVEPGPFATGLWNTPSPADTEGRLGSYPAEVAQLQQTMSENFAAMFESSEVPTDPTDVVNRYIELIDMKPGTRAFRNVVGMDLGVTARNESDAAHDAPFLEMMELTEITKLKSKTEA